MHRPSSQPGQQSTSSATETSSRAFVETIEYNRFVEFCDACRRFRYIGLCYGAPGIGKTLSARRYSRAEKIHSADEATTITDDQAPVDTILYTTSVINTPSRVDSAIRLAREGLIAKATRALHHEAQLHSTRSACAKKQEGKRSATAPSLPSPTNLRSTPSTCRPFRCLRRDEGHSVIRPR